VLAVGIIKVIGVQRTLPLSSGRKMRVEIDAYALDEP
jgi:hypothetical protein